MTIDIQALAAPFPAAEIEWRVGSTNGQKTSGLALAYLTARHVMDRLDEVCGPGNWQDRYEFHGPRTVCYLSIRIDGEWVTKADGAGDSDVEAEKGAISDALKRAAVKWGIGRYLYDLGSIWVEIEPAGRSFKIKQDQYSKLQQALNRQFGGNAPARAQTPASDAPKPAIKADSRAVYDRLSRENRALATEADFNAYWAKPENQDAAKSLPVDWKQSLKSEKDDKAAELAERASMAQDDERSAA
jgi:hypothetical protein